MLIDDDIDEIIKKGESKTQELNAKYAGLDIDALANFKSDIQTKEWEGTMYENKVSSVLLDKTGPYGFLTISLTASWSYGMDRIRETYQRDANRKILC